MAFSFSVVSLLSFIMSIFAIYLVFAIMQKVYTEKHRKPWLYIGTAAIALSLSELLRFFYYSQNYIVGTIGITEGIIYSLVFFSLGFLSYGLLLEYLILRFYKGKFVKIKFIPVEEGSVTGDLDIDLSNGVSYLSYKKDRTFMYEQFALATKQGFQGFLISEDNPTEVRKKFKLIKTPIAWLSQIDRNINGNYLKDSLDENSDIVDPLQINNLISFVDNFLDQSSNPLILVDCNLLFRLNSFYIALEFLKYISTRTQRYNGVAIMMISPDLLKKSELMEFDQFLKILE
jgi:hypothetical protein